MKGSKEGKGPPSTDLLICFPSRSHLTLMPKPICSPARHSEPTTRNRHRIHRNHHLRKSGNKIGGGAPVAGHVSPLLWAKAKPNNSDISEPTSPKVTCAGQIKVRPKPSSCKNWQSVMEEIERLHNNKKQKKRAAWVESLGFKKDVLQFLTCLRSIRFDFRCFGSFPTTEMTSDEEDDDDNEEDDQFEDADYTDEGKIQTGKSEKENSTTVFSKWFMILQENNQSKEIIKEEEKNKRKTIRSLFNEELVNDEEEEEAPCVPPSNALLLMRCRSAPAKSWQEEKEAEEEEEEDEEEENSESDEEKEEDINKGKAKKTEGIQNQSLVVMTCETDFSKFSSDIAKETWVVGGIRDLLSRSRSWKR